MALLSENLRNLGIQLKDRFHAQECINKTQRETVNYMIVEMIIAKLALDRGSRLL